MGSRLAIAIAAVVAISFSLLFIAHVATLAAREAATLRATAQMAGMERRSFVTTLCKATAAAGIAYLFGGGILPVLHAEGIPDTVRIIKWLTEHPTVIKGALETYKVSEKQVFDLMLDRPETYLEVVQAVVQGAKNANVPADVLRGLQSWLDATRAGVANRARYEYTRKKLMELRRVRDSKEIDAALRKAIAQAPDAMNKRKLEEMRANAEDLVGHRARITWPCIICCIGGCLVCGNGPECAMCCIGGCWLCGDL